MKYTHIQDEEGPFEIDCPSCGAAATWRFIDDGRTLGAIDCVACGTFEMGRSELEMIQQDRVILR